jgi:hypothetical protein
MSEYTLKSARHNAPTIVIEGEYQVLGWRYQLLTSRIPYPHCS